MAQVLFIEASTF